MISRRELLTIGAAGLTAAALPSAGAAQTPKRGGTLTLRTWDPPHFDHILAHAYKTHVVISFTHSRLLRHKAGPTVKPGSFVMEGDLAESWQQTSDTTYVFKLRKGVRFHAKPPVNGRELTADDVRYTFERILTDKGSANVSMYRSIAKVEAVDRYTARFTLKEPFAWFLDMIANPMSGAIIAKECVETFGDLRKPEAVIGTGPYTLEAYRPNVSLTLVRNPHYFVPSLPYIDRVEMLVDEDNASRISAFLGGKYDLGWEFPGTINRSDWIQLAATLKQRRPGLRTMEFPSNVVNDPAMRTDRPPFSDARVRQAISLAIDRQGLIDATLEGVGVNNGPLPAALSDWALPIDQLGEGARYYRYDPAEARRLLAAAGHPGGLPGSVCFSTYGSTLLVDTMTLVLKNLKDVGIDARLEPARVWRLPGDVSDGEVRFDGVRPAHAVRRARQLPVRTLLYRRATEPEPRQRCRARRLAREAAAHRRGQGPPRCHSSDPAASRPAAVLRPLSVGDVHRGVGGRAQELRAEPRLRLRRPTAGRLARPLNRP